jgi:dihydroorotate dehydrogenase (fumarate)
MADLATSYMGLELSSPVIAASSGLSKDLAGIKLLAQSGAGAVVLKSLFEEQINAEISKRYLESGSDYAEAYDYISRAVKQYTLENYLQLIEAAKKEAGVPIIASINCVTASEWTDFAAQIQSAGADAIELNVSLLPTDPDKTGDQAEEVYFKIIDKVSSAAKLPIAVKIGNYSAGLANLAKRLDWTKKVSALVIFNRYYQMGIDLQANKITGADIFSTPADISLPLRWTGLLSGNIRMDIAGTTGVHTGSDAAKMILAGASAVQVASCLYKNGPSHLAAINAELSGWMDAKGYSGIADFRGKLSSKNAESKSYERVQFMKYYGGLE